MSTKVEIEKLEKFKKEIAEVCKKFGLSLSHEDTHGSFQIVDFSEQAAAWFKDAKYVPPVAEKKKKKKKKTVEKVEHWIGI